MTESADNLDKDQFYFLPLGGCEEFGCNLNLYAYNGQWLAVDCGIGFADERYPGVDILLPDPAFIAERRESLAGLIVTHAHEDHIGAVAMLWQQLQCPVYATPFSAAILRNKFAEIEGSDKAPIHEIHGGDTLAIGPFTVHPVAMSHSVPQTVALIIECEAGRVVHSADWNLDPEPVIDQPGDTQALQKAGEDGVLAYIGDSTNALVPGRSGSESAVEKGLEGLFKETKGRIVITLFASNIGRLNSICLAAMATGRHVCLLGRSLNSMVAAAQSNGYLQRVEDFVDENDLGLIPEDQQVIVATGSQGESRAAMARISRGEWKGIDIDSQDTVIFSAREIPGNAKEINALKNRLSASGARIIAPHDTKHTIHVSGHPYADEIRDMLGWLKPELVVPVHGERLMLEGHAELARECGVPNTLVPNDGSLIRLGPNESAIVDHVHTGLIAVAPQGLMSADDPGLNQRRKLQFTGAVHISLVMEHGGEPVARPKISVLGLCAPDSDLEAGLIDDIEGEIADSLVDIEEDKRRDEGHVAEEIRRHVRRMIKQLYGIKPQTNVHVFTV